MDEETFDWAAAMTDLPSQEPPADDLGPEPATGDYATENWDTGEQLDALAELLANVAEGRISPKDADNTLVGPEPVRIKPTIYLLDHQLMARWSLEMAAAWIKFRNAAAVSRHLPAAFLGSRVWVETRKEYSPSTRICRSKGMGRPPAEDWRSGYELCHLRGTNLHDKFRDFRGREQCLSPIEDWFELLRPLLIERKIVARGYDLEKEGPTRNILASYWHDAKFGYSPKNGTTLIVSKSKSFSQITFSASSILEHFHEELELAEPTFEFHPWDQENDGGYRRDWHAKLHKLLLEQSPLGFPIIPGTKDTRDSFLLQFLKKAPLKPEARKALIEDIGFDEQNSNQNIDRFIKRRCKTIIERHKMEFGPAMAAAIAEVLNIKT
jgi:hypothetical protein